MSPVQNPSILGHQRAKWNTKNTKICFGNNQWRRLKMLLFKLVDSDLWMFHTVRENTCFEKISHGWRPDLLLKKPSSTDPISHCSSNWYLFKWLMGSACISINWRKGTSTDFSGAYCAPVDIMWELQPDSVLKSAHCAALATRWANSSVCLLNQLLQEVRWGPSMVLACKKAPYFSPSAGLDGKRK